MAFALRKDVTFYDSMLLLPFIRSNTDLGVRDMSFLARSLDILLGRGLLFLLRIYKIVTSILSGTTIPLLYTGPFYLLLES
jgi:hypothetical protein